MATPISMASTTQNGRTFAHMDDALLTARRSDLTALQALGYEEVLFTCQEEQLEGFLSEPEAMVLYHVCRICHRHRSRRYHEEHPFTANSASIPPGICSRCRVSALGDNKAEDVQIQVLQSEPIRIGIECLIPQHELLGPDQVLKQKKRHRTYEAPTFSRPDMSYAEREHEDKTTKLLLHDAPNDTLAAQVKGSAAVMSTQNLATLDTINTQAQRIKELENQLQKQRVASKVQGHPSCGLGPLHALQNSRMSSKPGYTESIIRAFAREEIEKYRQSEKKLDAHPGAYAHGRMVPIERHRPINEHLNKSELERLKPKCNREPSSKPAAKNNHISSELVAEKDVATHARMHYTEQKREEHGNEKTNGKAATVWSTGANHLEKISLKQASPSPRSGTAGHDSSRVERARKNDYEYRQRRSRNIVDSRSSDDEYVRPNGFRPTEKLYVIKPGISMARLPANVRARQAWSKSRIDLPRLSIPNKTTPASKSSMRSASSASARGRRDSDKTSQVRFNETVSVSPAAPDDEDLHGPEGITKVRAATASSRRRGAVVTGRYDHRSSRGPVVDGINASRKPRVPANGYDSDSTVSIEDRPLSRARVESPSRGHHYHEQTSHQIEQVRSRGRTGRQRDSDADRHGPYREEDRGSSMEAAYGSSKDYPRKASVQDP